MHIEMQLKRIVQIKRARKATKRVIAEVVVTVKADANSDSSASVKEENKIAA